MSKSDHRWLRDLFLAIALGIALLGLSFLRIWGDTGSGLFGGKIIDAVLGQSVWGSTLGTNLALFAATLTALHVGFGVACAALARLSSFAWADTHTPPRTWLLLWFCLATVWLLIANAALFPGSSLGAAYAGAVTTAWHGVSLYVAATVVFWLAVAVTIVRALLRLSWPTLRARPQWVAATAGTAALAFVVTTQLSSAAAGQSSYDKPHVVLIGLDSLRLDVTAQEAAATPHLNRFLDDAVVFNDATTPLARTFPSWVSILSGRAPATTGALINLLPRDLIHAGETLPMMFRDAGYRTVYAIDEVRFSNLDETYGFDEMIAPPIGASDFIIGFFADTPLSNLLVNSRLGEWLFPYVHANRAAYVTYDPDTFVRKVDRSLNVNGPTFLSLHLTLAHWPYSWADSPRQQRRDPDQTAWPRYRPALARVDQQFASIIDTLKHHGLLDNAIVIVLSDHGESLGSEGDDPPWLPEDLMEEIGPLKQSGHGTSVFDQHQYRVLLSMRFFGKAAELSTKGKRIDAPTSLLDIAPTLADLLSLPSTTRFDGLSLKPFLGSDSPPAVAAFTQRIRLTETEFNPPGISLEGTTANALRAASSFYQVDPVTDRISVRRQDLNEILHRRDYAAFRGSKLLAAVHDRARPGDWNYVFVDGENVPSRWTPAMGITDVDQRELWEALRNHMSRLPGSAVSQAH